MSNPLTSLQATALVTPRIEALSRRFSDAGSLFQSLGLLGLDHLRKIPEVHSKNLPARAEAFRALWSVPRTPTQLAAAWNEYLSR